LTAIATVFRCGCSNGAMVGPVVTAELAAFVAALSYNEDNGVLRRLAVSQEGAMVSVMVLTVSE